ncbi:MAG: response regulator transcription factor [Erysipelothrix sp.]|nr:response regulator transcription factor [Erysipelothrix sp.]
MINILIVDDHAVVGEGTKNILASEPDFNVNLIVCSEEASQRIREQKYDVYIFDLDMPEINGLDLTKQVLSIDPEAKIIIFSGHEISAHFNQMVNLGVSGFISKTFTKNQLIRAVWCAVDGQAVIPIELLTQLRRITHQVESRSGEIISLSDKEVEILIQASKGLTNEEIGKQVYISKRNVERHLTIIFKKLQVNSRGEAITRGKELGIIPGILV